MIFHHKIWYNTTLFEKSIFLNKNVTVKAQLEEDV